MTRRTIVVDSEIWKVYPTGRITVYGKDEFGLLFELGTGPERKRRFTRYSPLGSRVPTHLSLSSLSGSCWTSSANRSPRGRRPRPDTAHSKQSASWTPPHGLSARQRSISADMGGAPTGRFSSLIGVPPDYGERARRRFMWVTGCQSGASLSGSVTPGNKRGAWAASS